MKHMILKSRQFFLKICWNFFRFSHQFNFSRHHFQILSITKSKNKQSKIWKNLEFTSITHFMILIWYFYPSTIIQDYLTACTFGHLRKNRYGRAISNGENNTQPNLFHLRNVGGKIQLPNLHGQFQPPSKIEVSTQIL